MTAGNRGPAVGGTSARARHTLVLLTLIAVAPIALATLAYLFLPREARTNYGELIAAPAPPLAGTLDGGRAFALSESKGKWVMFVAAGGACAASCEKALYAMRQARTMQNAEADRVVRIWWVTDDTPPAPALVAANPGLIVARAGPAAVGALPAGENRVHLVDPRGNLVLKWPIDPDIKALARDLTRLLRASQIG